MDQFFYRHGAKSNFQVALIAGLGAAIAIGILSYLTNALTYPLLVAPFGASCVLVFAVPASPFSQPINIIGGHIVCAAIGLALQIALPGNFAMMGLAVGLAIVAMMLLRIVHPPAGATALLAYSVASGWMFLLFPVLVGSLLLVATAWLFHKIRGTTYPLALPKN